MNKQLNLTSHLSCLECQLEYYCTDVIKNLIIFSGVLATANLLIILLLTSLLKLSVIAHQTYLLMVIFLKKIDINFKFIVNLRIQIYTSFIYIFSTHMFT